VVPFVSSSSTACQTKLTSACLAPLSVRTPRAGSTIPDGGPGLPATMQEHWLRLPPAARPPQGLQTADLLYDTKKMEVASLALGLARSEPAPRAPSPGPPNAELAPGAALWALGPGSGAAGRSAQSATRPHTAAATYLANGREVHGCALDRANHPTPLWAGTLWRATPLLRRIVACAQRFVFACSHPTINNQQLFFAPGCAGPVPRGGTKLGRGTRLRN